MKPIQKQINLYQAEFRPAQVALPTASLLLGVAVFAVGLLLVHALDSWRFGQYRAEVDALSKQADQLEQRLSSASQTIRQADPQVVTEATQLENRIRALEQAQTAINSGAMGSMTGYAAQFSALTHATAAGAWLTQIDISNRGHDMTLTGGAVQGDAPANLIAALRRQPLFTGLTYASLQVIPAKAADESETPGAQAAAGSGTDSRSPKMPDHLQFTLAAQLPEGKPSSAQPAAPGATQ